MQFSNDERHAETLSVLAEVRDYIARWPKIPVNLEMLALIDAHLDDPLRRLVQRGEKSRSGANFSVPGQMAIAAKLVGDKLTLSIQEGHASLPDDVLLSRLRNGEEITLKLDPDTARPPDGGLSPYEFSTLRRPTRNAV